MDPARSSKLKSIVNSQGNADSETVERLQQEIEDLTHTLRDK